MLTSEQEEPLNMINAAATRHELTSPEEPMRHYAAPKGKNVRTDANLQEIFSRSAVPHLHVRGTRTLRPVFLTILKAV